MRLQSRLRRLERAYDLNGHCSECGGFGRVIVLLGGSEGECQSSDQHGCATCGKLQLVQVRFVPPPVARATCN